MRFLLLLCACVSRAQSSDNQLDSQLNEGNDEAEPTEHQRLEDDLYIDVPGMVGGDTRNKRLGAYSAEEAGELVAEALFHGSWITDRLHELFQTAKSTECRELVAEHLGYFVAAVGREERFPFEGWQLTNTCPEPVYEEDDTFPPDVNPKDYLERKYQPPPDEAEYIDDPADLKLLYAILAHDDPASTIRLIEALDEPGHAFVIHIDGKESSQQTYEEVSDYAADRDHIHVLPHPYRARVNWGGFSMVNATLQILKYAFGDIPELRDDALEFHKVVQLSSSTYPLASNTEIRREISNYPLDANLMNIINIPKRPGTWQYFVECDDSLHRIHHLELPVGTKHGFDTYTSSQWFIISREFAQYLAEAKVGSFVHGFLEYAEHVVVADETFFGTVLKNTEFCTTFHHRNFNLLEFGLWESDLPNEERDSRKCPMKDPDLCGRSPTILEGEDAAVLELNDNLFARKFIDSVDSSIKDLVDVWRAQRESQAAEGQHMRRGGDPLNFDGHDVLIVAKETMDDAEPLCLSVDKEENNDRVWLSPCFSGRDSTFPTNLWETGAVSAEGVDDLNRWQVGPCSTTDGDLEHDAKSGSIKVSLSSQTISGPRCALQPTERPGMCLRGYDEDDDDEDTLTGEVSLDDCTNLWNQLVSFGDGTFAPPATLFATIPHHLLEAKELNGQKLNKYMCLGVWGRSQADKELDDDDDDADSEDEQRGPLPLSNWSDKAIWLKSCGDHEALIEWSFFHVAKKQEEAQSKETDHLDEVQK